MTNDYTLAELEKGIDSADLTWGVKDKYPQRFEFPALVRLADLMNVCEPTKANFDRAFPHGFVIKMQTDRYSSMIIVAKPGKAVITELDRKQLVEAGFKYAGNTTDSTMLNEIARDYLANGVTKEILFRRENLTGGVITYWIK